MNLLHRIAALVLLATTALIGPTRVSLALLGDSPTVTGNVTTAASFDVIAPTISTSVIGNFGGSLTGYVRQGGTYHVYASATDAGVDASGIASVRADVSAITADQTSVDLVAGAYSIGGTEYGYRSGALIADGALAAGSHAYSITAVDSNGNLSVRSDLSVTVDNTRPAAADVQTTNAGATAGSAEAGDVITYSFTEPIDPESILAGWTGGITSVVVSISDGGLAADVLSVRTADNLAAIPLGTVALGGLNYVVASRDFGATGTPSMMTWSGSTVVVTLGTASGASGTELLGAKMTWAPSSAATDAAGNGCSTTSATESGVVDVEF